MLLATSLAMTPAADAGDETGGGVAGVVRWTGGPPPPARIVENTTDPEACGAEHRLPSVKVGRSGGIADVIVRLVVPQPDPPTPSGTEGRLVLDNRDCRFEPGAAVLLAGSVLELRNSDPVLHTVHLYGPTERNVALPLQGSMVPLALDQPGLYTVKCDVHGWMEAYLRVDRHPWHAVTDPRGRFALAGAPEGRHTLEAWHPRLGERRLAVDVVPGESSRVTIVFAAEP